MNLRGRSPRRSQAPAARSYRPYGQVELSSLPLDEMIVFMRYLGGELVFSLLRARRPRMVKALTLANERQFLTQVSTRPHAYRDALQRALQGEFPEWREAIAADFERRLGLQHGWNVPRELWTLIGQRAWLDPTYQRRMMRRIDIEMRCKLWYGVDEPPAVQFTTTLYWTLIALMPPQRQFLRDAVRRLLPNFQRSPLEDVQDIARTIAETSSESLTLWDQWLLLHVFALWKPKREGEDDLLWTRIKALPLWQVVNPPHTAPPNLTLPGWFEAWLKTERYLLTMPQGAQTNDD